MNDNIEDIQATLRKFASDRDWEQFHSPKNLSMALSVEVGELMEHFQWLTDKQSFLEKSDDGYDAVKAELADIFLYLIRLCDQLNVDILDSASKKIVTNGEKYPVELCKGKSTKYNRLNR